MLNDLYKLCLYTIQFLKWEGEGRIQGNLYRILDVGIENFLEGWLRTFLEN